MRPKTDIRSEILLCLTTLEEPGNFAYGNSLASSPLPGLHIPDHGDISLPLSPDDAQIIISKAKPLTRPGDENARTENDDLSTKIWELSDKSVSLKNPGWSKGVDTILAAAHQGLGLKSGVARFEARFSKLILYEPGASLESYRDTAGDTAEILGTLIICLPSGHEGGKIVFVHNGNQYDFDTQSNSHFDFKFAAHYDDVTHDMLPITSGYRLELLYNLLQPPKSISSPLPLGKGVQDSKRQLSLLLARYDKETESPEADLPHMLIHRLEHEDIESCADFAHLRGADARQVQALKQLSADLDFGMYLATLVHKEEDILEGYVSYNHYSEPDTEQTLSLEDIVSLDGSKFGHYSGGIDKDELLQPDILEEGWDDEDGVNTDYGYQRVLSSYFKVLILVPARKKLQFLMKTNDTKEWITHELEDLKGRSPGDPYKTLQLPRLCEMILDKSRNPWNLYNQNQYSPEIYEKIGLAALDIGRLDLFDRASVETSGRVVLHNAAAMGSLVARTSLAAMKDRLDMGVKAAKTDETLRKFLEEVETGLKNNLPTSTQYKSEEFAGWKNSAFFLYILTSGGLSKANGQYMLDVSMDMEWTEFEKNARPVLETGLTVGKVAFLNKLMSQSNDNLTIEQRSLAEWLVKNIWNTFSFHWNHAADPAVDAQQQANFLLDGSDFLLLIENTHTISPSLTLSQTIMPAILKAIPQASDRSITFTSISIARCLLSDDKPDLTPISEADGLSIEATCSSLIQIFLCAYLERNVNAQPVHPKHWSVPAKSCNCRDCSEVNFFLMNIVKTEFKIKAPEHRRSHLTQIFAPYGYEAHEPYDISTIRQGTPHTWRIVKHRRHYERQVQDWRKQVQTAKAELGTLLDQKDAEKKLRTYFGEHYDIIMNADRDGLPNLGSRFPMTRLSNMNEARINSRTGQKRSLNQAYDLREVTSKKAKSNLNGEQEDSMKENIAQDIEVVDLTEI